MNAINTDTGHYMRVLAGAQARSAGEAFEQSIVTSLEYFERAGWLKVAKTPEPIRQIGPKDKKGHFIACHEKKAQVDFAGTLKGGRSIRFEAKQTETDRFLRSRLTDEQMNDLAAHEELGALCFVLLCFGFNHYYRVPWRVWRDMKALYGRLYVTEQDITQYRIPAKNGIIQLVGEPK